MSRFAILDEIQTLDPVTDHQRIMFLSTCYDFPFDTTRSLEFALLRTFCVPSISRLLDHTGEFQHRTQRRYDDTDILISHLIEHGYHSDQGRRAIEKMNQLHGRFTIRNDDFLYVLSTFIYEPIRWNQRYGWRPLCTAERESYFLFWRAVGQRMGIREIPSTSGEFEQFNRDYERRHFRYSETNERVGTAIREMLVSWFPRPLTPLSRDVIHATLDEPLLEAFGFPPPRKATRWLVHFSLQLRAKLLRWLPPRRHPRLRTQHTYRSHPHGYRLEELGPPAPRNPGAHAR